MNKFEKMPMEDFLCNPFTKISKEWMLVTAGDEKKANSMTASWGGLGVMWGKNVAYVVIRQSRYTKEFIDKNQTFSLTFMDEEHRSMMQYLGKASGRDEDKMAKAGVEVGYEDGVPYVGQGKLVLVCKALSATLIKPEEFLDDEIDGKWYGDKDYHTLYIAEIKDVLKEL